MSYGRILSAETQIQGLDGKNASGGLLYVYLEPHTTTRATLKKVKDGTTLPNPLSINELGMVEDFVVDADYKYWVLATDIENNEIYTRESLATMEEGGGSLSNKYFAGDFIDITDNNVVNVAPFKSIAVSTPLTLSETDDDIIVGIDESAIGAISVDGINGISVSKTNNTYYVDGSALKSKDASQDLIINQLQSSMSSATSTITELQSTINELESTCAILNVEATDKYLYKNDQGIMSWNAVQGGGGESLWVNPSWESCLTPKNWGLFIKGQRFKVYQGMGYSSTCLDIQYNKIDSLYLSATAPFISNTTIPTDDTTKYLLRRNGYDNRYDLVEYTPGSGGDSYWTLDENNSLKPDIITYGNINFEQGTWYNDKFTWEYEPRQGLYDFDSYYGSMSLTFNETSKTSGDTLRSTSVGADNITLSDSESGKDLIITADGIYTDVEKTTNILTQISSIADILSQSAKGKYLHQNEETGALEWVDISALNTAQLAVGEGLTLTYDATTNKYTINLEA